MGVAYKLNMMDSDHEDDSYFAFDEAITLDSLKKRLKIKITASDDSLVDMSQEGLRILNSIGNSFGNTVLDNIFEKAIGSASYVKTENCTEFTISGFK